MTERRFRTLITALLVFPLIFGMDVIIRPIRPSSGDLREILYPVFIIPILFLAYSVWFYPQNIQKMFGPFRSDNLSQDKQLAELFLSISPQKRKIVLISAAIFGVLVFCTLINISLFTLRTAGKKADIEKVDVISTSRAGILPTSQLLDERTPSPEATEPETAIVTEEAPTAIITPQSSSATQIETPLATAGVTPSKTIPLTTLTKTPSVSSTQQICSVGTQCLVNGVALTVMSVSRMDSIDTATPAAGNNYLVLNVLIENIDSGESMLYAPTYFSVQDTNGTRYSALSISPEPVLSSGPLPQGGTADGNISFEVKATSSGFVVFYAPPALDGSNPIRIELGQ